MNLIDFGKDKWDYLIKASWAIGSDTGITDEANFNTSAPGSVEKGSLFANDTGTGTVTVYANSRVQISCSDGGYRSSGISTFRGLLLKGTLGQGATNARYAYGWSDVSSATNLTDMMPFFYGSDNYALSVYLYDSAGSTQFNTGFKTGSQWATTQVALLCGGYSGSLPWDGSASGYADGWAWFYKNGSNWELIYKMTQTQTATMYLKHWNYQTQNTNNYRPRVPNVDLSHLLKPLVLDTFTDTNGTLLTAHTPDVDVVGGGWQKTDASAAEVIQSNEFAPSDTTSEGGYYIDCGKSDVFVEVNASYTTYFTALLLRVTDVNNFWRIFATDIALRIVEMNAGTTTQRATTTFTGRSSPYRITASANGQEIKVWHNDTSGLSYSSAALNETVTNHGVAERAATYDNFAIYPIGTNGEYSDLDRY